MNKKSRDALVEGRERWTQWGPSVDTTFPCSSSPVDIVPKPSGDSDFPSTQGPSTLFFWSWCCMTGTLCWGLYLSGLQFQNTGGLLPCSSDPHLSPALQCSRTSPPPFLGTERVSAWEIISFGKWSVQGARAVFCLRVHVCGWNREPRSWQKGSPSRGLRKGRLLCAVLPGTPERGGPKTCLWWFPRADNTWNVY